MANQRSTFCEGEPTYVSVDELAETPADVTDLLTTAPAAVQLALLEQEIAGRLLRHAGGRVSLSGSNTIGS
jgi:DNA processing protein